MTFGEMRQAVSEAYFGNAAWKQKVEHMSVSQVVAIYYSMEQRGMFGKAPPKPESSYQEPHCRQLSIFDGGWT